MRKWNNRKENKLVELSSDILINIENNKGHFIEFLTNIINIRIIDISFIKILQFDYLSEYGFILYKFKLKNNENKDIEIYLKIIKEKRIKQSVFCYWSQIFEEELENNNSEMFLKRVLIKENEINEFKRSIFLEMENNNTEILKYGTKIYLIKLLQYIKKMNLKNINYFPNSLEDDDILLIGVKEN